MIVHKTVVVAFLALLISGCGGHGNASRLLASVNAQTLKNEFGQYSAQDETVLAAIKSRNLKSLLDLSGPLAILELGEDGLASHYSKTILHNIDDRSSYEMLKKPKMIEDEKGNIGYLFSHSVIDLEGQLKSLHIGIVKYYDKGIRIRTLSLE